MLPYIKFIEITNKIIKLDKFPTMSPLSQKILDQIALYAMGNKPLTVREMLDFHQIASPATIHKHLSRLRKSGYVTAQSNDNDKRTKHLTQSLLGYEYIDHLSKAILKAAAK
jgi:DNA-binding MarR family transcriptional regulator